jgi:ParB-like chromosome segregation protein Spo0J
VPVWVKTPKSEEILLQQIIENWTRSDLNPFELADSLAQIRDANGYNQTQLATATGKNKSEISRLISLLDIHADVQKFAREDDSRRITKRHLFAVARLDTDQQKRLLQRIRTDDWTALDAERHVARLQKPASNETRKGAPVTRRRYATNNANAVLTFRKKDVCDDDVLLALSEIEDQIRQKHVPE